MLGGIMLLVKEGQAEKLKTQRQNEQNVVAF